MVLAAVATWPLWAAGYAVAIIVYIALGYLLISSVRGAAAAVRRAARAHARTQRASIYDGDANPTLLEVAILRAEQERTSRPQRRAA